MSHLEPIGGKDEMAGHEVQPGDLEAKPEWLQRWVLPYIEDSALWPVLIVLVAHVMAFISPMIAFTVRDQSIPAGLVVVWLAYMSYRGARYERVVRDRHGSFTWILVVTWAVSFVGAYYGMRWDVI